MCQSFYSSIKYYKQLKQKSYTAEISVFALDDTTNETVGLKIISTRGIAVYVTISLFSSPFADECCVLSFIKSRFSGFKTDAVDFPAEFIPPGILDIFVTLQRGNIIRAFCVIATIAVCES